MVEPLVFSKTVETYGRTGLGIESTVHQAFYARLHKRPHAHDARLKRYVERTPRAVVTKAGGSRSQYDYLGVRAGVGVAHCSIGTGRDHPALHYQ